MKNVFFLSFFFGLHSLHAQELAIRIQGTSLVYKTQTDSLMTLPSESSCFLKHNERNNLVSSDGFSIETKTMYQGKIGIPGGSADWWEIILHYPNGNQEQILSLESKPKESGFFFEFLGWVSDGLLLRSVRREKINNEEGIYFFNFSSKELTLLLKPEDYSEISPIIISDDGRELFFVGNLISGNDVLIRFDIQTKLSHIIFSGQTILRFGETCPTDYGTPCTTDPNQPEMRSPINYNKNFCVTRIGAIDTFSCQQNGSCEPSGSLCSPALLCEGHCVGTCSGCYDAVDMVASNPYQGSNGALYASAGGFVIVKRISCPLSGTGQGYGYGFHIVIRHSTDINDTSAPETLYAHFASISSFFEEGDWIEMGQFIGMMGNSQVLNCTGNSDLDCLCVSTESTHLHFEYHEGACGLYSKFDIMTPFFFDIGCLLLPNELYTAGALCYPAGWSNPYFSVSEICSDNPVATLVQALCDWCDTKYIISPNGELMEIVVDEETLSLPLALFLVENTEWYQTTMVGYNYCSSITSYIEISIGSIEMLENLQESQCVLGCMNFLAQNYNPNATLDNGSCLFGNSNCDIADLNGDGVVGLADMIILFGLMGQTLTEGDLNSDGVVNSGDFFSFLNYFGTFCE